MGKINKSREIRPNKSLGTCRDSTLRSGRRRHSGSRRSLRLYVKYELNRQKEAGRREGGSDKRGRKRPLEHDSPQRQGGEDSQGERPRKRFKRDENTQETKDKPLSPRSPTMDSGEQEPSQGTEESSSTLPLYLHTPAVIAPPPSMSSVCVILRDFKWCPATIFGEKLTACFDTGSTETLIKYDAVKHFDFLKKLEAVPEEISYFSTKETCETYPFRGLPVILDNTVTMLLNGRIVRDSPQFEKFKHAVHIGLPDMCTNGCKDFISAEKGRRSLHFPEDGELRPYQRSKVREEAREIRKLIIPVHTREDKTDPVKMMLLDTGAYHVYSHLVEGNPTEVKINLTKGVWVSGRFEKTKIPCQDFFWGINLLSDYSCILDYARANMHLDIDALPYKIKLTEIW